MTDIFAALAAPFSQDAVSWRAQSMNKEGTKAMALAYIDARDVMRRLDEIVGPANWQDEYHETPTGTAICTIRIRCGDAWVAKSDGAGATDVEAEKGRLSDAFKRCAVKWGIGRYLYDLDAPWVPCESYEGNNGKRHWRKWTANPWNFVKVPMAVTSNPGTAEPGGEHDVAKLVKEWADNQMKAIEACVRANDLDKLKLWRKKNDAAIQRLSNNHGAIADSLIRFFDDAYSGLAAATLTA